MWSREWAVGPCGLLEPCSCAGSDGFWTSPFAWSVLAGMGCCVARPGRVAFCGKYDTHARTALRFSPRCLYVVLLWGVGRVLANQYSRARRETLSSRHARPCCKTRIPVRDLAGGRSETRLALA